MNRVKSFGALCVGLAVSLCLFPLIVFAQPADPTIGELVATIGQGWLTKNYPLLMGAALTLLVLAARTFGAKLIPWLATPRGGAVLSGLLAFLVTLTTALSTGQALTLDLLLSALSLAATASGIWSLGKNAMTGSEEKLQQFRPIAAEQAINPECTPIGAGKGDCE